MRVVISGAAGFLGQRLGAQLAGDGHEVIGIVRERSELVDPRVEQVVIDLARPIDTAKLPAQVDALAHLAQSRRFREFPDGAGDVFAVNVASTAALLDYARSAGAGQFVLASTGGVYAPSTTPIDEHAAVDPGDFYQRSKLAAETVAGAYAELLELTVLRPFFVYGAGQRGMLVASLAERVLADQQITVQGDPGIRINPIHVDDAAAAFCAALERGASGTINIGGTTDLTIGDLARTLAEIAGREPRVEHAPASVDGDLLADVSAMRERLGVEPRVELRDGLADVLAELGD